MWLHAPWYYVEVREQLAGNGFPLLPGWSQGSDSGPRAWRQVLLSAEPACRPVFFFFFSFIFETGSNVFQGDLRVTMYLKMTLGSGPPDLPLMCWDHGGCVLVARTQTQDFVLAMQTLYELSYIWGQETTLWGQFSPSTTWLWRPEFRLSGLVTSTFNQWVILQVCPYPSLEHHPEEKLCIH